MRIGLTGTLATLVLCLAVSSATAQDTEFATLRKQLESGSLEEKTESAQQLGEIGPAAAEFVPLLVKSLGINDPALRHEIIEALGRIDSNPKESVPALTSVLADPFPLIRLSAISALKKFGAAAQSSVPQLKKLLFDKEPLISVSAAHAIAEIESGKAENAGLLVPVLVAGLKSDRQDVSAEAIQGLVLIGSPSVPSLQQLIGGPSTTASVNAIDAIAGIGHGAAPAVDRLIAAAKSTDLKLRWHAISAIGDIGPAAKAAVPTLIAGLSDSDAQVRFSSGQALQQLGTAAVPALIEGLKSEKQQKLLLPVIAGIGPNAKDSVSALSGLLQSNDAETKREALIALASIGADAKSTVPELIKTLENKQFPFRSAAAYALGKIGAKEATPSLKSLLESEDPTLALASVWALLQLDPANAEYETIAIPRLIKALDSQRPEIRREVAATLGQIGERAKGAVPGLQKHLSDNVPVVRREALIALAEIGPDSQAAVDDIIKILNEGDSSLRPIAGFALGRIGAPAAAAVPSLQKMLKGRNPYEKSVAAWALVHIAPNPQIIETAIPLLVAALHGAENPKARAEVAKTLGEIGSGSALVKEGLTVALKDSDESVRKAADQALAKLK